MVFIEDLMKGSLVELLGTKVKVFSLGKNVVIKDIDDLNTYIVKPQSLMPILLTEDIFNNNFPDNDTGYVIYWMREEIGILSIINILILGLPMLLLISAIILREK